MELTETIVYSMLFHQWLQCVCLCSSLSTSVLFFHAPMLIVFLLLLQISLCLLHLFSPLLPLSDSLSLYTKQRHSAQGVSMVIYSTLGCILFYWSFTHTNNLPVTLPERFAYWQAPAHPLEWLSWMPPSGHTWDQHPESPLHADECSNTGSGQHTKLPSYFFHQCLAAAAGHHDTFSA